MNFYNRETELAQLKKMKEMAYEGHSKLTVLTGRRRVGKTSLIIKALDDEQFIYLFVGRKNEADLCKGYVSKIDLVVSLFLAIMLIIQLKCKVSCNLMDFKC